MLTARETQKLIENVVGQVNEIIDGLNKRIETLEEKVESLEPKKPGRPKKVDEAA